MAQRYKKVLIERLAIIKKILSISVIKSIFCNQLFG